MASSDTKRSSVKKRIFVAAIDLGTTYSGWAYSTLNDPDEVHANQAWFSGAGTLASQKAPTCVLLTPKKEFKAFGYDAETQFAALADENKQNGWYYFRRFKMALFDDRKLNRYTNIEDISGKKMPALVIFAHAIRFLRTNFMTTVRNRITDVKETDVNYIITVPAIWNDMAKRFMRQAAIEAGIPNDQLVIALEPEAASIWCQGVRTEVRRDYDAIDLGVSTVGTQYMIVDLGGGTADITVHEKRPNNTLLEIHKATGGEWGGTEVDKLYIELLANIIGKNEWRMYEQREVEDKLDIYRNFETKKRNISTDTSNKITLKVPVSFQKAYEQNGKRSTSDVEKRFNKTIIWKGDKIRIDAAIIKKCFEGPVNRIVAHIKDILSEKHMQQVSKIMLVGGFAESPYVQETFKEQFTEKQIITPQDCGLAVLKGAVLFGQTPTMVTARIARYTYGLDIAVPFDPTIHSREKLVKTDAGPLCRDTFWKAVEIGQEIKTGHEVSRIGRAVYDYQQKISLKIVKSKKRNPVYTTEEDCEVIGNVLVPMDPTLKADDNAVDEIFEFGGTEVILRTLHRTSGAQQELSFDL